MYHQTHTQNLDFVDGSSNWRLQWKKFQEVKLVLQFILDKAVISWQIANFPIFEVLEEFGEDLEEPRSDKNYS